VSEAGYRYLPLRREDIQALREFRNAQMDVLRQNELISPERQEAWFEREVVPTQGVERPHQVLVSILADGDRFVGYGGLTNLNWPELRAEVSFLVDPERARDPALYRADMTSFLAYLARLAFEELGLNRLFAETYAFREAHIGILEESGYQLEGRLREHIQLGDGKAGDSVVHGLLAAEWRAA
jgi:RimJ/RimL family protein N-acetyltransferase